MNPPSAGTLASGYVPCETSVASAGERNGALPMMLTAAELATLLRMPMGTVYHLLETGQIPGARKYGRAWRIRRDLVLGSHPVEQARVSRSGR